MADIVERAVMDLVPYARNPRKNDAVVDQMAASIREFGFKVPILALSDGTIVDGHLRLKAAQKLKIGTVPVILCDEWTPAQVKAFRLMANKSVAWAEWDTELLRFEMEDLKSLDFDLELTGFGEEELARILEPAQIEGLTDPDSVPDLPGNPVTVPGDLWILDKHRLMCGDSTFVDQVQRLFNGVEPILMVTDPPYGVDYDPKWRNSAGLSKTKRTGVVKNDDRIDWGDTYSLFPGDIAYIWHAGRHTSEVQASIERCGFEIRCQIIWAKPRFAISRGHYHWQHEPCWYAVRKGKTGHWNGDRTQTTLWQISAKTEETKTKHGTQKPVECMSRPIANHTNPGQAVYDPFMGSGTTIIAAEGTSRVCFGMEIDPAYIDVAVERWEKFTGKQAVLEGDGLTFQEISASRCTEGEKAVREATRPKKSA
jgi:DNA modification methylase